MRKKLFAVIMSAMMMITFMPSMAFAVEPVTFTATSYTDNYSKVTGYLGTDKEDTMTIGTVRTFETNGMVKVVPDIGAYAGYTSTSVAYYWDLDNVVCTNTVGGSLTFSTYPQETFEAIFGAGTAVVSKFTFKVPSYVKNAKTAEETSGNALTGYTVKITRPAGYLSGSFEKQEFKGVVYKAKATNAVTETSANPGTIGTLASKDFVVSAKKASIDAVKYYIDKVKVGAELSAGASTNDQFYDGAEHAIVTNNVPGVTFTYKQYNYETGKWDAVDSLKFKNANPVDEPYSFQITPTLGKTTATTPTQIDINVQSADVIVRFVTADGLKVVSGEKYTAFDYIEVVPSNTDVASAETKAVNKAIKADWDAIKTFLNTVYDFTATPQKFDETKVDLAVKFKEAYSGMTVAQLEAAKLALVAQYPAFGNFDIDLADINGLEAVLTVIEKTTNDVTAINQTKTFHVKNAKALKAKKTFKLKGDVADWGTITYVKKSGNSKITVAKDGKVTVKKGLKKGTYKVKIKVKAPKVVVTEYKTLKVRVVK